MHREFNKDFFNTWSHEMAYVLGFLFADGYVMTNTRGSAYFCFCSTDREIILKIRNALESNHKIGKRTSKVKNWKPLYVLQIGSKEVCLRLETYGIFQNKSLNLQFPEQIPKKFLGDLVRGYFDGDGNVYFRKHFRKDRGYMYWVFASRFTSRSLNFLFGLQKALSVYTVGGSIIEKKGGHDLVFSRRDSVALFHFMYDNVSGDLFLERKFELFSKAVNILYGGKEILKM